MFCLISIQSKCFKMYLLASRWQPQFCFVVIFQVPHVVVSLGSCALCLDVFRDVKFMSVLFLCVSLLVSVSPLDTEMFLDFHSNKLWIFVWHRGKHKKQISVKEWYDECIFCFTRDCGRGLYVNSKKIWHLKCLNTYLSTCHSLTVFELYRHTNSHCLSKWSLFKTKDKKANKSNLLYVCANGCWNKLKAKSWDQCWGTWLVTSSTNYITVIFCK